MALGVPAGDGAICDPLPLTHVQAGDGVREHRQRAAVATGWGDGGAYFAVARNAKWNFIWSFGEELRSHLAARNDRT